jgi:hypothetical protein
MPAKRTINCKHWTDCGLATGGCCAIGKEMPHNKGKPPFSFCAGLRVKGQWINACPKREPIDPRRGAYLTIEQAKAIDPELAKALLARRGRAAWEKIHLLTLENRLTRRSLGFVIASLGCGGCSKHAFAWLKEYPLPDGLDVDQFIWGYEFHKAVNHLTGKTTPELAIARQYWQTFADNARSAAGKIERA